MSYLSFFKRILSFAFIIALFIGCSQKPSKLPSSAVYNKATMRPYTVNGKTYYPQSVSLGDKQTGLASWYGPNFHGKRTSNGEVYNMHGQTAAHKIYPMNTMVKVTNKNNNKSTIVRINDRGPFVTNRIIDLSKKAANDIGMLGAGTVPVEVEVISFDPKNITLVSNSNIITTSPKSFVGGIFMVQIGAFRNIDGAKKYEQNHKGFMGYDCVYKTYILDNKPIYRVFMSGFRSEEEARDFANSSHFYGAFIVRE